MDSKPRSAGRKPAVVAIMGPTASGKTAAALAIAQRLPCEIISVDSALVYRGMDVGTAKPSTAERAAVPHHLIDILEPTESYSVMQFRTDALALIAQIQARGRLPLLVGGTMLYFKGLQDGLDALPPADPAIRAELDAEAAQFGMPAMHARLAQLDPITAARLPPNDSQRIQRALEVQRLTGQPMSALLALQPPPTLPFNLVPIALEPSDRAALHARIALRFDQMLGIGTGRGQIADKYSGTGSPSGEIADNNGGTGPGNVEIVGNYSGIESSGRGDNANTGTAGGLLAEVARLRARGDLHPGLPSMRCVGYRQAWAYLDGECDLATLRETGIAATRQLAKRQLTWLRSMPDRIVIDCLDADAPEQVMQAISRAITPLDKAG